MLTGDKMETAENIGLSCNLISSDFELIRLVHRSDQESEEGIGRMTSHYRKARELGKKVCIVIDGQCLAHILSNLERSLAYLGVMKDCESVICCRVTPKQKAAVVRLVNFFQK